MSAWDRYWYGPVAAIRPYLAMKIVFLVLAFDVWTHRVPFAWRYGTDGFNVAHFRWLDALQPLPTPATYIALMLGVGILALVCALTDPGRWARALLALAFTYAWAMSLLNVYQHHYFLSLVLAMFVFFPRLRGADLDPGRRPGAERASAGTAPGLTRLEASAWAYVLLAVTVAIVYAFTAVTKVDREWQTGLLIRLLAARPMVTIASWAARAGVSPESFWAAQALGVLVSESIVALGYLLAPCLDRRRRPWLGVATSIVWLVAVGFHAGASLLLGLEIGWFSYYMIGLACVYLLPGSVLRWAGVLVRPMSALATAASAWSMPGRSHGAGRAVLAPVVVTALMAAGAIAAGLALDLPGAPAIGLLVALVLVAVVVASLALGRLSEAWPHVLATGLAVLVMWVTIAHSSVRFDYYGNLGRFRYSRDDVTGALEAIDRAGRYQPHPF